jgi:hypothetical protein
MSGVLVRRVSVMIVIVAIAFVTLPAADARPLAGTHSTAGTATSWMAALSTWVSSYFTGTPAARTFRTTSAAGTSTSITGSGGIMKTNTGSCVDPNGHPIPCNSGS